MIFGLKSLNCQVGRTVKSLVSPSTTADAGTTKTDQHSHPYEDYGYTSDHEIKTEQDTLDENPRNKSIY